MGFLKDFSNAMLDVACKVDAINKNTYTQEELDVLSSAYKILNKHDQTEVGDELMKVMINANSKAVPVQSTLVERYQNIDEYRMCLKLALNKKGFYKMSVGENTLWKKDNIYIKIMTGEKTDSKTYYIKAFFSIAPIDVTTADKHTSYGRTVVAENGRILSNVKDAIYTPVTVTIVSEEFCNIIQELG